MPTLFSWKRKREETEIDQRAQAGDYVTLFEEDGSVYNTGILDRLDHQTVYVEIDADGEKTIIGWTCNRVEAARAERAQSRTELRVFEQCLSEVLKRLNSV